MFKFASTVAIIATSMLATPTFAQPVTPADVPALGNGMHLTVHNSGDNGDNTITATVVRTTSKLEMRLSDGAVVPVSLTHPGGTPAEAMWFTTPDGHTVYASFWPSGQPAVATIDQHYGDASLKG